ncbi:MAG: hypothetical protein WD231_02335 [Candidatus Woykebacteria bacterium]
MRKNQIYIKHQAFNTAHKEVVDGNKKSSDGFVRPKKYHHAPEKLNDFASYVGYFHWSNELYASSVELIALLRRIYDRAEAATSSWNDSKKNLNSILKDYNQLKLSLNDLYDDISEFQNCMLATDISEKQAQIEALSDQVRLLGTLENKIVETCNRKLYEISASRITVTNLSIALMALIVSILSVLFFGK